MKKKDFTMGYNGICAVSGLIIPRNTPVRVLLGMPGDYMTASPQAHWSLLTLPLKGVYSYDGGVHSHSYSPAPVRDSCLEYLAPLWANCLFCSDRHIDLTRQYGHPLTFGDDDFDEDLKDFQYLLIREDVWQHLLTLPPDSRNNSWELTHFQDAVREQWSLPEGEFPHALWRIFELSDDCLWKYWSWLRHREASTAPPEWLVEAWAETACVLWRLEDLRIPLRPRPPIGNTVGDWRSHRLVLEYWADLAREQEDLK